MADTMTPEQRHRCMAAIRGKDTKPEMLVRRYLHSLGYRYGLHNKKLPGSPDLVLRKYKTVIFIHGCFWHGHEGCKFYRLPKTNEEFWEEKITRNRRRDQETATKLAAKGWNVVTIWECDLKNKEKRERTLSNLHFTLQRLQSPPKMYETDIQPGLAAEEEGSYKKG
ncbi:MAG: DNA mismatch endonuclease Vsr [Muribaculaceae bacterium]|nr:DNA mismatch endonuclease Vsr [Muribaculaceae bacterium]